MREDKSHPDLECITRLTSFPDSFKNDSSTAIQFSLPIPGYVTLNIYDMLGREIQTLVSDFKKSGTYFINIDADELSSGIYFYKLHVENSFSETKKMLLIR